MLVRSDGSSENTYQVPNWPSLVHGCFSDDGLVIQFVHLRHFHGEPVYVNDAARRSYDVKDWYHHCLIGFEILHIPCNCKICLFLSFWVIVNAKIEVIPHPLANHRGIIPFESKPRNVENSFGGSLAVVLLSRFQTLLHGQTRRWNPRSTLPAKDAALRQERHYDMQLAMATNIGSSKNITPKTWQWGVETKNVYVFICGAFHTPPATMSRDLAWKCKWAKGAQSQQATGEGDHLIFKVGLKIIGWLEIPVLEEDLKQHGVVSASMGS